MLLEPDCKVVWESDLEPQNKHIIEQDALKITDFSNVDVIVTNRHTLAYVQPF